MKRSFVLTIPFAVLLVACATSPTGRQQLMLVSEETAIASSAQAYVATVGQLRDEGKLSNDPILVDRIDRITSRLVAQAIKMRPATSGWKWSVAVIDDPEMVNAWCMAGGRMAFYSGLSQKLDPTDDEIAQVMGHEIAHALANHSAEQMSVALASSVGVAAVGVATDGSSLGLTGAAAAAALALQLPNSRTAETEADQIGIELAAKAGYDPRAAVTLWRKMNNLPGGKPPEFLSTHPNPQNRIKALEALAPKMQPYFQQAGRPPSHQIAVLAAK